MSKRRPIKKETPTRVSKSGFLSNQKLHIITIGLLATVLYANTIGCDYTWDDAIVITENDFTKTADFRGIFSKDTFHGFFKEKKNLVAGGRYRPLTLAMFAVEYQISQKPFIGHLLNIIWYALTGIVLYLLLLKMLNPQKDPDQTKAWFIALVASLLFISHPIHTEVVSNIKGRDEIMTLLGALTALYFALRAYYEKKIGFVILTFISFFLGLLAKENAITFLAIAPLVFYFFTKARLNEGIKYTVPFFAAAAACLIIRTSILGADFGSTSTDLMNNPFMKIVGDQWVEFSFVERMATITFTLGKYLQLLIAPVTLTHDYYPRQIDIMTFGNWKVLLSLFAYVGMGVYALMRLPKRDIIAFGILFFLLTLSIVSNIVFPIGTNMSERFMFMPSVGFAIVVATLLWRLGRFLRKKEITSFADLKGVMGILGVILLLFSIKTIHRNLAWQDNFTLFSTDIKTSDNSAKLLNAMGGELTTRALLPENKTQKNAMLSEAIIYLKKAITIHPTYANAYLLLGNAHNYSGQYDTAISYYKKSQQYKQGYKEAMNNEAITYREAAMNCLEEKKDVEKIPGYLQEALRGFEETRRYYPDYPDLDANVAITHRTNGRYYGEIRQDPNQALIHLNQALKYNPDDTETLRLMSLCYGLAKQHDKMIEVLEKLIAKQPDSGILYLNMSSAYYEKGDLQRAEELRQKAYQLNPGLRQ